MSQMDKEIMRSFAEIQEEMSRLGALLRIRQGECDGVHEDGAPCVRLSTHRGYHEDKEGRKWLDAE